MEALFAHPLMHEGVLNWAFERAGENGAVLFFPDQHLGRNTGLKMGIPRVENARLGSKYGSNGRRYKQP